jgi:hypothetical protein
MELADLVWGDVQDEPVLGDFLELYSRDHTILNQLDHRQQTQLVFEALETLSELMSRDELPELVAVHYVGKGAALRTMVSAQAEDAALWNTGPTTPRERALQRALRELHALVERET